MDNNSPFSSAPFLRLLVQITITMNVLYALFLAYHLNTISTYALTVSFPHFTFQDLLATWSNGTEGPVPSACQQVCAPIVPYAIDGQVSVPTSG
jgi:hypothetical protein